MTASAAARRNGRDETGTTFVEDFFDRRELLANLDLRHE